MSRFFYNKGWSLVIFLSLFPIPLWFLSNEPINSISILPDIGEILALVGIVIFAINFILATRLSVIENLFNGLNNVYDKHNILGQLALILLLFHPIFLIPKYSPNIKEAAQFIFFSNVWARNLGIFSLYLMIILIILTIYLRPKYNIWKLTHKVLGFAFLLGAIHAFTIPSVVMENKLLSAYIMLFCVLGILSFLYRSIFSNFLVKTSKYTIEKIIKLNNSITEITFKNVGKGINYLPGQFLFASFIQNGVSKESHPFSITSAPEEENLKIAVKSLGDYTKDLNSKLVVGSQVFIEGPFGKFTYSNYKNKKQLWVAGGIGVTPFVSMAKNLIKNQDYQIVFFYCVRNIKEAVYKNVFEFIQSKLPNSFKLQMVYSDETGRADADQILALVQDSADRDIFICAPVLMIKGLRQGFIQKGINKSKIHSEEFSF